MRELHRDEIARAVASLCEPACLELPPDVEKSLKTALDTEKSPAGKEALELINENIVISREEKIPLCQDCGFAVLFLELGQELHIVGGSLTEALNEGIAKGYTEGYLRKSIVSDPLFGRKNTTDNTPPVVHIDVVPGDRLKIVLAPKGGGSENMSALAMLKPAQGVEGVKAFVRETVERAGSNPCPPIIVGIGIGGTADKAMVLAKKALLRPIGPSHPEEAYGALEKELLTLVNSLGIGPQGFGGIVTALAVHIETFPCHIASLPVAINLQCHSARHAEVVL
ncbi:MAG: fumarate hydratase [Candidatus Eremiobacteraeota bacterium]|nr:fumarate hydratase [Candidatus Eremiobacteraeota bacterium]